MSRMKNHLEGEGYICEIYLQQIVKNILKRKEESDTYLTHVCRHHWSRKSSMKYMEQELSAYTMAFISCRSRLQLIKATVQAESYFHRLISSSSFCSSDVYRHESGICRSLLFFFKYFLSFYLSRFFFYINTLYTALKILT